MFFWEFYFERAETNMMQVEILTLENKLSQARTRLGDMRKLAYQDE
jgi:hypothetical protein